MMGHRNTATAVFFVGLLVVATPVFAAQPPPGPPAAGGASLPDDWTGQISLEWKSGIPDDSPLHQQIEYVSTRYEKRWNLYLTLHAYNRGPVRVRYRCTQASVDYFETSATVGKNGAISTSEVFKIEAGNRILDGHQCNLLLVVDSETKKYWIEVGGFEIPDASKTGEMIIEITDENGTRTVGGPIGGEEDVIEPIRFEGQYSENRPSKLIGQFDANVEPPPGVDMTHATVGGDIDWNLSPGACPEARDRCYEEANRDLGRCEDPIPEAHDGLCADGFYVCLGLVSSYGEPSFFPVHDCVEDHCTWELGTPEFDRVVEAYVQCLYEYRLQVDECDRLCP